MGSTIGGDPGASQPRLERLAPSRLTLEITHIPGLSAGAVVEQGADEPSQGGALHSSLLDGGGLLQKMVEVPWKRAGSGEKKRQAVSTLGKQQAVAVREFDPPPLLVNDPVIGGRLPRRRDSATSHPVAKEGQPASQREGLVSEDTRWRASPSMSTEGLPSETHIRLIGQSPSTRGLATPSASRRRQLHEIPCVLFSNSGKPYALNIAPAALRKPEGRAHSSGSRRAQLKVQRRIGGHNAKANGNNFPNEIAVAANRVESFSGSAGVPDNCETFGETPSRHLGLGAGCSQSRP